VLKRRLRLLLNLLGLRLLKIQRRMQEKDSARRKLKLRLRKHFHLKYLS
jgi:hypothetical protein